MSEFKYSGGENLEVMSLARNYNNDIFKFIIKNINKESNVLEFGAGKGEYCNRLVGSFDTEVVELDGEYFKFLLCKNKYSRISETNKKYDLIYCINVLEHIENDMQILLEFYDHMKENATLKLFIPARKEIFSSMDKLEGHYRRYTKKSIYKLLTESGFEINKCEYFDMIGYFATLIYKLSGADGTLNKKAFIFYDKVIFPISRVLDKLTIGNLIGKNLIVEASRK